jgi:integrase
MTKQLPSKASKEDSIRDWPFQLPSSDRNFSLSPLEKTALANWSAQGYRGNGYKAFEKETELQLNRLIQPIKAVILHWGLVQRASEQIQRDCVKLLLHEMHRRQTSLWAWDHIAWIEIVGNTHEEFKSTHHAFEHAHNMSSRLYRHYILGCAYLLGEISIYQLVADYNTVVTARGIFGGIAVKKALYTLSSESKRTGRGKLRTVTMATCSALLANRNPVLEKLTLPVLEKIYSTCRYTKLKNAYILLSTLLHSIKVLPDCLPTPYGRGNCLIGRDDAISADWANLLQAWCDNTTYTGTTLTRKRSIIGKAARWATEKYPGAASPHQWTRSTCIAFVADVIRLNNGQWQHPKAHSTPNKGKPTKDSSKAVLLADLRAFFRDCHDWELLPISFNPDRHLATPKSILRKCRQNPRPITPAIWIKLQEAALSLTDDDLPIVGSQFVKQGNCTSKSWYPLDMTRAMAIVWLYTGLRSDEIRRLQVGCIQPTPWQVNESNPSSTPKICSLTVPVGKNGSGFSKPVSALVGDFIEIWEKIRPPVPKHWDYKTSEVVNFLFVWRGKQVGPNYLNTTIIPMLCRKAGIPVEDALGKISSHRARHTLATQLSNAPTPMSDPNLRHWLGHTDNSSLGFYVHTDERKIQDAYTMANHVSIDKRQLEQLKEPATNGDKLPAESKSIPRVDLGHGFCIYPFFDKCSQRRPCANCSFYKPKASLLSQTHEAKKHLQRMLHSLPLSQEVRQAVEDAIAANETLVAIMRRNQENQEDDSSKSEGSEAADIEGT